MKFLRGRWLLKIQGPEKRPLFYWRRRRDHAYLCYRLVLSTITGEMRPRASRATLVTRRTSCLFLNGSFKAMREE